MDFQAGKLGEKIMPAGRSKYRCVIVALHLCACAPVPVGGGRGECEMRGEEETRAGAGFELLQLRPSHFLHSRSLDLSCAPAANVPREEPR